MNTEYSLKPINFLCYMHSVVEWMLFTFDINKSNEFRVHSIFDFTRKMKLAITFQTIGDTGRAKYRQSIRAVFLEQLSEQTM
jgi:hypothetical protein